MMYLGLIVLLCLGHGSAAPSSFLPPFSEDAEVETVELLLRSVGTSEQRVRELQEALAPSFSSLPKNEEGRLEWPALRQLIHRHFIGEEGWHIKGLEPHRNPNVTLDLFQKGRLLGDALPGKLIRPLQRYIINGCTLRGSAVVVAILEHVSLEDGVASESHLKASYRFNAFTTNSNVSNRKLEKVIDSAMIIFITGGNVSDAGKHRLIRQNMNLHYPGWKKTQDFTRGVARDFVQKHGNASSLSFADVHAVLDEIGMRYGKFQEVDCQDMKAILMDMDNASTGRVPLSQFYARKDAWQFSESEEYLRSLGVLEESEPGREPKVLISNYLTSDNNCLAKSPHQNVCCLHECEGLLRAVETKVRHPVASPTEVLAIVEGLSSPTIKAPRHLTPVLKEALLQIAGLHRGKIPLHGRLFSQWLHYAFPHECAFPHLTDSVLSVTEEEFSTHFSKSTRASPSQVQAGVRALLDQARIHTEAPAPLPLAQWSLQEELLAGSADDAPIDPWARAAGSTSYPVAVVLAAIAVLCLACAAALRSGRQKIAVEGVTGDAEKELLTIEE